MSSSLVGPALLALGSVVFLAAVARSFFRVLLPRHVADNYVQCYEGWHEARLNGCNHGLLQVPQQPINTYTNAAYLAAGVFVAAALETPAAWVFALAMGYLCVGSMLFHAVSTEWGHVLDVTGIYAVFASLVVFAGAEWARSGPEAEAAAGWPAADWVVAFAMLLGAAAAVAVLAPRYHETMELKIAALLVPSYLLTLAHNVAVWPWLLGSVGLFGAGYACWLADKAERFPIVPWGHGAWHLLTAAAAALAFYAAHLA